MQKRKINRTSSLLSLPSLGQRTKSDDSDESDSLG